MVNVPHSTLTTTDLHEPKGAAAATSGQVYVANGSGSGVWTTISTPVFMQKHIAGLTYQNFSGDTTNDIQILPGSCRDSTNTADMLVSASFSKRLDASWAVGDTNGGIDTGSVANTSYHIWLIKRSDTGVVDALFSLSATSPTMPTNYDKKRRIGSFLRIGGVNRTISVLEEAGGAIEVLVSPSETSAFSAAATGTLATVPNLALGVKFLGIFALYSDGVIASVGSGASGAPRLAVWSPDQASINLASGATQMASASTNDADGTVQSTYLGGMYRVRMDTSNRVMVASNNFGVANCKMLSFGWVDYRRD
jgi:hypothetical protein